MEKGRTAEEETSEEGRSGGEEGEERLGREQ